MNDIMQRIIIPKKYTGMRIDLALADLIDAYSRNFVQRLIREELVLINNKIAKKGNRVVEGDKIIIQDASLKDSRFTAKNIPIEIIYEDDDLLIVNKPPGLLTHPSSKEREVSLVNALLYHCKNRLSGIGGERRPGIVHRLDKNTSGLLMVAKHDEAHKDLAKQIQERRVEKHYLTLVLGLMGSKRGTIEAPLLKTSKKKENKVVISQNKKAKPSLTHFTVQEAFQKKISLLDVQIVTGRMHQIRVHLSAIRHPIIGDEKYGNKKINTIFRNFGLHRQFLHAYKLSFQHPRTHQQKHFEIPLPKDLSSLLDCLRHQKLFPI